MKTLLITGGAGFIGSNLLPYLLAQYPDYLVVNLDKLTYAGSLHNVAEVAMHPRHHFIQGDISDRELVYSLFSTFDFQGVIHLAAESHVDRSIQDPTPFIKTNVEGTFVLLDAAHQQWMERPGLLKERHTGSRFLHISTDEVYGSLGPTGVFTEASPYAPNNPYSATKAGSDFLVRSYVHTYGFPAITTHASNNYGPKQYPEKLIPMIIQRALAKQPITIHGQGVAIRDWLYVLDHCKGIDLALHQGCIGEHYNFGGNHEQTNLQVAHQICALLDQWMPLPNHTTYQSLIELVADRPGNDQRYALATKKAEKELGWKATECFETGLQKTLSWYLKNKALISTSVPIVFTSMYVTIKNFPQSLQAAISSLKKATLKNSKKTIHQAIITGMGSSGLVGNLVKQCVGDKLSVPLEVNKDYTLPAYVNEHTLLIVVSYSGNTQETIEAFQTGIKKNAHMVVVTSGGLLQQMAYEHGLSVLALPKFLPPRASLDHTLLQLLFILYFHHLMHWDFIEEIQAAIQLLGNQQAGLQIEAEKIAKQIKGYTPVIYTTTSYEAVAIRLRQQLNENSKQLCWHHVLPELNHNEIVGWASTPSHIMAILLHVPIADPRLALQQQVAQDIIQKHAARLVTLTAQGTTDLIRSLYLIHLGDWISFYLAQITGVDPMQIQAIDQVKAALQGQQSRDSK
eukprot:gene3049-3813_t